MDHKNIFKISIIVMPLNYICIVFEYKDYNSTTMSSMVDLKFYTDYF